MKRITFFFIIVIHCGAFSLSAQSGLTTHFLGRNPYANIENPALNLDMKGYFGFPAFSNFNLTLTNTAFHYKNLFDLDKEGYPTLVKPNKFVDKLSQNNNWLNFSLNEEILGFGFRTNFLFFSLSYRLKLETFTNFSKDIFGFFVYGNMHYSGADNPARMKANLSLNLYQEVSLNVQATIGKRLFIAARPKFLMGLTNITTDKLNANIYTNPEDLSIAADYNLDMMATLAFPQLTVDHDKFNFNSNYRHRLLSQNRGFAIDLGAIFEISRHFGVGLAVNDLGFINWNSPAVRIRSSLGDQGAFYRDGQFFFNGLSGEQISELSNKETRNQFFDTLQAYFPIDLENASMGKKMLTTKVNIEGYFKLNDHHKFILLFQNYINPHFYYPKLTIAYNGRFGRVLDLAVHYSIMPSNYGNLGLGLGLELGPVYLYLATENLISLCSPLNGNTLNAQIGFCFKIKESRKRIKTDDDNLINTQEENIQEP
ncbi:MAG: DUF5723 family protein [Bacteroidales bacterium]|jgi:hypothetical protein|nr:DUF5723 family protein [Bacteroidales bacterium]